MGMNIYTVDKIHIGKRYAAGRWCWDCKIRIIEGDIYRCKHIEEWAKKSNKAITYNPVMRELGFDKSRPLKHNGIDGASGFIWQVGEYGLGASVEEVKQSLSRRRRVVTEYGKRLEMREFWDMFNDIIIEDESDADFC